MFPNPGIIEIPDFSASAADSEKSFIDFLHYERKILFLKYSTSYFQSSSESLDSVLSIFNEEPLPLYKFVQANGLSYFINSYL